MKTEHSLVTPLCRRLGLDVPIVQAPMAGGWTTPQLVASACAAGALGCIAASRLPLDELRAQIRFVRSRTSRPFAVNVQIAPTRNAGTATTVRTDEVLNAIRDELRLEHRSSAALSATQSFEDEIGVALELRAPILSLALGDPQPYVAAAHSAGALVIAAVTSVAEAVHAEAAGVDAIVAQGSEAGGHCSTFLHDLNDPPLIGTMALVPQIVDAVSIPVIASGGIADGRGLLAALALGAQAAQIGTRFLLASESGAPAAYRERLTGAHETDTAVTDLFTGRPARAIRNALYTRLRDGGAGHLGWPRARAALADIAQHGRERDDPDWFALLAGQALRLVAGEAPAADLIARIVSEAESTLVRLASDARSLS